MSERGGYRCCFKACQSASSERRGIKETLFRFPKDIERSKLWVSACGREELISKTAIQLYNSYRVCKLHFANNMFLNYEKTRLQPHAISSCIVRNNDEEASSSSSNIETHCINTLNIENTQEENTVLDRNILNEKDQDVMRIDRTIAKVSDVSESETQTPLSLSSTTPRKVHLYQQIRGYKRKITNLELELQQTKKAKKEDINTLNMLLDKYFPKQTSEFLKMQARLFQKKAKGRRYDSTSFKQHCLSIYFSSPKVYRDLANKLFCLPSCATLKRFTQNCYICPGLQENVFQTLKMKTDVLSEINKYCILCIDEMSLKAHLFYNITTDKVIGFEDIGCS
ncbi:uncharacterized protein [Temnothorax nylanderi]|uniref:uncharacterized protein isoform X1 n=1 Tax=Temnothorax nylanderi TaxID=102681 RepID=UPI003A8B7FDF